MKSIKEKQKRKRVNMRKHKVFDFKKVLKTKRIKERETLISSLL